MPIGIAYTVYFKTFLMKYVKCTESQEKHTVHTHHQGLTVVDCHVCNTYFGCKY